MIVVVFGSLRPADRCFVAQHTVQDLAEPRAAALFGQHPRADLPRRVVPNMLVVTARQLGDPVVLIVLMKACDRLLHC